MTKIRTRHIIVPILFSVFALGYFSNEFVRVSDVEQIVAGQARNESRRCSNRTLNGAYGIKFEGQKIVGGPFVSIGRITFNGNGQFTTSEIGRFNGEPIARTFTGPYTVNDDCTGFLDFTSTISVPSHEAHGNFIIVDEGREFFVVDNEEGWAANGVGKRL